MEEHVIGIDVGTSGAKVLLLDAAGAKVGEALHEYPLSTPRPLWAEQDPRLWWEAVRRGIDDVLSSLPDRARVGAVGSTGQMHGLVLLDAAGEVLRPAILWNDQRTAAECEALTARVGEARVLELTGNPILPGFTAPKIEWVRRNEPEVFSRVAHVLLPKDYVRYRLTGELHTDVADASGTSLLEVGARAWSAEMLEALAIPREWLPEVHESPVVCARVSSASECALTAGTPVVAGAGDQAAQAVGSGIVEEGLVSATIGTSGVVFAASDRPRVDPRGRLHAFCHAVPGKWHLMGVVLSAGGSFRWYRDTVALAEVREARDRGVDPYDLLTAAAEEVAPGSHGLIFLGRAHLSRAVMEGVTYALRDSLELMRELGLRFDEVRASGGGANSPFWRRMMADAFHAPVVATRVTEGAAYGAALLAAVGAGVFASVEEASRSVVETAGRFEPDPAASEAYDRGYARFRALYPALRGDFERAAEEG